MDAMYRDLRDFTAASQRGLAITTTQFRAVLQRRAGTELFAPALSEPIGLSE